MSTAGGPTEEPGSGPPLPAVPPGGLPEGLSPPLQPAGSWELDLAAASLRVDTSDADTLFEALGAKLERVLGTRARVQRTGRRKRSKRVSRIVVDSGGARLEAVRSPTGPVFLAAHAVRGITLQTSEISADEWLDRLVALVRDEASRSNDVRYALGRMLDT